MTREEIESEITCLRMVRDAYGETPLAVDRAIGRLRADLAKLDGPAQGFVRHWYVDDGKTGAYRASRDRAKRESSAIPGSFVFFVDIPLPRVVEIEGKVEK